MRNWTFAQWGAWALKLPAHTRVFVADDVFESLCMKLIANDRVCHFASEPTWCVLIRTVRVTPKKWRDRCAA